jgi:hemerythrin
MPFMQWSDELSVNIKLVDDQHKLLVGMLNRIWDALKRDDRNRIMASVLDELIDYTSFHFSTEEGLFRVHRYPERIRHQQEHETLTAAVKQMKERFSRGDLQVIEFLEFLKDWLNSHIIGSDRKFGPFFNNKGIH